MLINLNRCNQFYNQKGKATVKLRKYQVKDEDQASR